MAARISTIPASPMRATASHPDCTGAYTSTTSCCTPQPMPSASPVERLHCTRRFQRATGESGAHRRRRARVSRPACTASPSARASTIPTTPQMPIAARVKDRLIGTVRPFHASLGEQTRSAAGHLQASTDHPYRLAVAGGPWWVGRAPSRLSFLSATGRSSGSRLASVRREKGGERSSPI